MAYVRMIEDVGRGKDTSWTPSCSLALAADSGATASACLVAAVVLVSAWTAALSRENAAAALTVISVTPVSIAVTFAIAILTATTAPSSILGWATWRRRWGRRGSTSVHRRWF